MNRRGFVGATLAGIGGLFFPQKFVKAEAVGALPFWSPSKSKFVLQCRDRKILYHFTRVVRWLNLGQRMDEINDIYEKRGEVFIHTDIECSICEGTAIDTAQRGNCCNHPGGTIHNIKILNNDFIVKSGSSFAIVADSDLQKLIKTGNPQETYDKIPDGVKKMIKENGFIPLSNRTLVVIDSLVGAKFIEEKIFRPIAEMQGFLDEEPFEEGRGGFLYPHVIFHRGER